MGVIDQVKERLDIVDVISAAVPLQKAGRSYKGLCPFHSEKTPSFVVFPETQTWHCFGACNTGGDVFAFVMRRENLDFGDALRVLAQRAGVVLEAPSQERDAERQTEDRLRKINALASQRFHDHLLRAPAGRIARDYLQQRGITQETIGRFQLGYALDEWQDLSDHLAKQGYAVAVQADAGVVIPRDSGGYYDRFRGRLMFPIRDVNGHVIGFGARVLDDSQPKYLNSPQTPLFDKSSVLYGIDQAKGPVREAGFVVLVEGYMDVLMAHQCERRNVVASLGTALTEKHIRALKKLTKRLVLALDPDAAGDQATLRGLEVAQESFDRKVVPVPTARSLVRYEDQLDAEIRVATLPKGKDPDEVLREEVTHWDALVAQALPVVEYYLRSVVSRYDLSSPKAKTEAAGAVLPLIAEVSSPVERSHYLQTLARLLRVDERSLVLESDRKRSARPEAPVGDRYGRLSGERGLTFGSEQYMLLLLVTRSELWDSVNAQFAHLQMDPLNADDFGQPEERALFVEMTRRLSDKDILDTESLRRDSLLPLAETLQRVMMHANQVTFAEEEDSVDAAAKCALRLRAQRLRRESETLVFLQEDAHAAGDLEAVRQWSSRVTELARQLNVLNKAGAAENVRRNRTRPAL